MYKQDLTLNNLQGLTCHKTQPTYLNQLLIFVTFQFLFPTKLFSFFLFFIFLFFFFYLLK